MSERQAIRHLYRTAVWLEAATIAAQEGAMELSTCFMGKAAEEVAHINEKEES